MALGWQLNPYPAVSHHRAHTQWPPAGLRVTKLCPNLGSAKFVFMRPLACRLMCVPVFFFFFTYMWGWQCNPTELWRKLKIIIFDTWGKISIPHMEFPFPLWNKLITCWFWFCSALPSLRFHSYKISRTSLFLDNKSNIFWVLAYARHCYLPVVRKKRNNKTNKNTLMWYVIFSLLFYSWGNWDQKR